jgi:CelD/BcsL family acetyltransferase involved in cellulose biosynthesis
MNFRPAVSSGPAARARPQARRGAFALEPVEALPRLSERIERLAERALEPNPFFLPQFLEPAIQSLGRKDLRLAIFSDRDELHFFAPVLATGGGFLSGRKLSVWAHPYAPLGAPLIDRDMPETVCDSLVEHMRTSGRTVLTIPHLPLRGPTSKALAAAAGRKGFWTIAARQMRPILEPAAEDSAESFDRMVSLKRRRELDRQLRRLSEAGAVSFMSARTASELDAAFNMFVQLESSGWKGRRGTALQRSEPIREFARIAVTQLAQSGNAAIDVLRVGDKPVAALIRFDYSGLSIPWKIAYDETFAAFSPGKQLMCDETRRWLGDPSVVRVDPVCEQDNALLSALWTEREPYGTLILASRRLGLGARYRAGVIALKATAKHMAKSLLQPRAKAPKAAKPRRKSRSRPRSMAGRPRD